MRNIYLFLRIRRDFRQYKFFGLQKNKRGDKEKEVKSLNRGGKQMVSGAAGLMVSKMANKKKGVFIAWEKLFAVKF